MICYVEGQYVPLNQASVSVQDLGLLRGIAAFDFLRTYNRVPFRLGEHLDRLLHTCEQVGIQPVHSRAAITGIVGELVQRNPGQELNIRLLVTPGNTDDGFWPNGDARLLVLVAPLHAYDPDLYMQGCPVITVRYLRELPEAKTTNYIIARKALVEARRKGAKEALYTTANEHVLEGTTCNLFVVKKGVLRTPSDGILKGITRKFVIELASRDMDVVQGTITVDEFMGCDEAFLTGSNREIMPVTTVDGMDIGKGTVGPITQKLILRFRAATAAYNGE